MPRLPKKSTLEPLDQLKYILHEVRGHPGIQNMTNKTKIAAKKLEKFMVRWQDKLSLVFFYGENRKIHSIEHGKNLFEVLVLVTTLYDRMRNGDYITGLEGIKDPKPEDFTFMICYNLPRKPASLYTLKEIYSHNLTFLAGQIDESQPDEYFDPTPLKTNNPPSEQVRGVSIE